MRKPASAPAPLTDRLKLRAFEAFTKRWGRPFAHFQLKKRLTFDLIEDLSVDSLLEIGCQDGLLSLLIGRRRAPGRIVGIDLNERTIRAANQMAARLPELRAKFEAMDMDRIEVAGPFDLVLIIDTLQFSADPRMLLNRVSRLLASAGRLILYVPTFPQRRILFRSGALKRAFLPDFHESRQFSIDEVIRLAGDSGFMVERRIPCFHSLATLAKECHYMTARVHPMLSAALFPLLNLMTLFDGSAKEGNGVFLRLKRIEP